MIKNNNDNENEKVYEDHKYYKFHYNNKYD